MKEFGNQPPAASRLLSSAGYKENPVFDISVAARLSKDQHTKPEVHARNIGHSCLPRPALEGGHNKQGEHGLHDVVVVEGAPDPLSLLHNGLVDVPIVEGDELPLAGGVDVHGQIGAHEELPFEQLHPNNSKHEYKEHCHSHDVSNGLH